MTIAAKCRGAQPQSVLRQIAGGGLRFANLPYALQMSARLSRIECCLLITSF
jgi:hypothetical protein